MLQFPLAAHVSAVSQKQLFAVLLEVSTPSVFLTEVDCSRATEYFEPDRKSDSGMT